MWDWTHAAYVCVKTGVGIVANIVVPGSASIVDFTLAAKSYYDGDYLSAGIDFSFGVLNFYTFNLGRVTKDVLKGGKSVAVNFAKNFAKTGGKETSKKIGQKLSKDLAKGLVKDTIEQVFREGSKMKLQSFVFEMVKAAVSKSDVKEEIVRCFFRGTYEALLQEEKEIFDSIFREAVKNFAEEYWKNVNREIITTELHHSVLVRFMKWSKCLPSECSEFRFLTRSHFQI